MLKAIFKPSPKEFVGNIKNLTDDYINRSLTKLRDILPGRIKEVFALEGARGDHAGYKETSQIGRKFRKSVMGGNQAAFNFPTLVDDGELQESIEGDILNPDNDFILVIGTDKHYAKRIEDGFTDIHPRSKQEITTPPREFLFFTKGDELEIDDIFENEEI